MIYTVTLNPSLDYFAESPTFDYGKTNRTRGEYINPGGKGLNVSFMLSRFGLPSKAMGFISGFSGKELERLVRESCRNESDASVEPDFIDIHEGFTRINVKLTSEKVTEFNGSGIELKETHREALKERIRSLTADDLLILSGALPKGADDRFYSELASEMKGRFVIDTAGSALINCLPLRPLLIKPNDEELNALGMSPEELLKIGAENVLVSRGKDGASLYTKDGERFDCACPKVPEGLTLNTVAAGDTMIAAFLYRYFEGDRGDTLLRYAVAAGTAAAYSPWLPEKTLIEELLENF